LITSKTVANLLAALALLLFLSMAATRRLNFDESLAVRAGWLEVTGNDFQPAFLMPWTLLCGAVARAFADPGTTFLFLRLTAAGGVALAFASALRAAAAGPTATAAAAWLAIGNAAFATHALEFRYDAAVLILLLLAYRALVRETSPFWFGALAALLALHHLKGIYFAAGGVVIYLAMSHERRAAARRLVFGALALLSGWIGLLLLVGLGDRFLASLRTFATIATDSARVSLASSLGPTLLRDLAWWVLVLSAAAVAMSRRGRATDGAGHRAELAALAIAALGITFWLVHPHAWPYLVALPVPFLVIAAVRGFARRAGTRRYVAAFVLGLAIQVASSGAVPFSSMVAGFSSPMAGEVAMLRALRADASSADRILDPSGLAYFILPCTHEWYLDSLFRERIAAGTWMSELSSNVPSECTLVLNSYRLEALPPAAIAVLRRDFVGMPCGLAVRRQRGRLPTAERLGGTAEVESFW